MAENFEKKEATPGMDAAVLTGSAVDPVPEHDPPTSKKLSPASRQEVERFVKKWKAYIDDPELLDPPLRTMMRFVKRMAEEEGILPK